MAHQDDTSTTLSHGNTNTRTIIIGLSGPSSSGKTTLARLLRQIFNVSVAVSGSDQAESLGRSRGRERRRSIRLFILHEDDFYKTDTDIPYTTTPITNRTLQDWDCIESIDLPLLSSTLRHIKTHGVLPPELFSKEDRNTVGESGVSDDTVEGYKRDIERWLATTSSSTCASPGDTLNGSDGADELITMCLLDGFLLYPDPTSPADTLNGQLIHLLNSTLSTRLFIPSTKTQTITRRTARSGYVTLEGFWEDPEGYVEEVVWPNFGRDHAWLFGGHDDELSRKEILRRVDVGEVDRGIAREWGVEVGPGSGEVQLGGILEWAVGRVRGLVEEGGLRGVGGKG